MKNIHLVYLVVALIPIVVISFLFKETNFILSIKGNNKDEVYVRVKDKATNEIMEVELEEYVAGVIAGEMPAGFRFEALKAQGVAARSYVLSKINTNNQYDVVNTASDQVYITKEKMKDKWQDDFNKYYKKVKAAAYATKGEVLSYDNKIIRAYYFSLSNGYTQNAKTVFNENKTYLQTVSSKWDQNITSNYTREKKMTKKDFCEKLEIKDCSKITVSDVTKNDANYIDTITINNQNYYGNKLRKTLELRSADFDIDVNKNTVVITTRGFGHGVGMSQYGANEMAKLDYDYKEILSHYYTDIQIASL